ncbi:hypothetical protein GCM10007890_64280 [Methylobacterium tardum]|uniref:Uncharacterized protein n=1 Tax=Methylobacterium tardum TaxID=374432 RepID=A0AA37WUX1_9HYPH|nr:hypothetical protein GCM10007890_64280 [Methylobacterium tardum]
MEILPAGLRLSDGTMTDLLEKAVAKTRDLSPDLQDEIAHLMTERSTQRAPVTCLTPPTCSHPHRCGQ